MCLKKVADLLISLFCLVRYVMFISSYESYMVKIAKTIMPQFIFTKNVEVDAQELTFYLKEEPF